MWQYMSEFVMFPHKMVHLEKLVSHLVLSRQNVHFIINMLKWLIGILTTLTGIIDYDTCMVRVKENWHFPTFMLQIREEIFSWAEFTKAIIKCLNIVTHTMISHSEY